MRPGELQELLLDFYRDKAACRRQHEAHAASVAQYELNNTYQYIIAREDVQLEWLRRALAGMDAAPADDVPPAAPGGARDARLETLLQRDIEGMREFYDRWQPRVERVPNARHRQMLRVILGETLEHRRFFEQALAGRRDLLGRCEAGVAAGRVLPNRWIE